MIATRIRERCEQFARDENVYECGQPENGDYVKVDSLVSLYSELLAEKDREIAHLKEKVAHYDRWLSVGVYFTVEEYQERVYKPHQQLMAQAVRFAERLAALNKSFWVHWNDVDEFLKTPEAQAFLKEHQS